MQKRQSIAIIVALLCMLFFGGNVGANDEDLLPINIYVEIDGSDEIFHANVRVVIDDANQLLSQYDYQLVEVEDIELANLAIFGYRPPYHATFDNKDKFVLKTLTPSELDLSPILFTHFDTAIEMSFIGHADNVYYNGLVRFVAGLATYSISNCLVAQPLLNNLEYTLHESKYIHAGIAFYQGNCALILDEYEIALEAFGYGASSAPGGGAILLSRHPPINYIWTALQLANTEYEIPVWKFEQVIGLMFNCGYASECSGLMNIHEIIDMVSRRAQLYALAFDYDSAIADMDAAIELAEENEFRDVSLAELYTLRGEIIFLIYEWDRVLDNFNHALELDPTYAPAYFQRGVLYYTMALREDALSDFQHYLELAPEGQYAEEAQAYLESIPIELEALGG